MINKLIIPLLLFIVWIVMNGELSALIIISGIIVVFISLLFTDYMLGYSYIRAFSLPVIKFIKYAFYLFSRIILNGLQASYMIISGKINPGFVVCKVNPKITNEYVQNILATSITLTPGTITVDYDTENLTVLTLHADNNNPCADFEEHLIELNSHHK